MQSTVVCGNILKDSFLLVMSVIQIDTEYVSLNILTIEFDQKI